MSNAHNKIEARHGIAKVKTAATMHAKNVHFHRIFMTQSSGEPKRSVQEETTRLGRSPADKFAPLATTFRRRLLVGVGSASLVAVGANFGGITSSLLGLSPESGRDLKLDLIYPIGGYSRCVETNEGFG